MSLMENTWVVQNVEFGVVRERKVETQIVISVLVFIVVHLHYSVSETLWHNEVEHSVCSMLNSQNQPADQ